MIDLSDYSCDKCDREFSRHCKHCWHTADKKPTRFKPKKKTGIQTPEFRKPTPLPPIPANKIEDGHRKHKYVSAFLVGTAENLDRFIAEHEDIIKIKNDGVYWSIKDGTLGIVTTREWVDYFNGQSNIIPNTKENEI